MNIAIIFAGGHGKRYQSNGTLKQFVKILGKPLIIHTLQAFENCMEIDKIYISTVKEYKEYTWEIVKEFQISKVAGIVNGGDTGQDSIYNALAQAKLENPSDSIVLIHDGVRPIIYPEVILKNIESVKMNENAITCLPCCETILISEDGHNPKDIPFRKSIYTAQAPQSFKLGDILEVHKIIRNRKERYKDMIDSCTMYHYLGRKTYIVPGNYGNIKVTVPEDIFTLEELLKYKYSTNMSKIVSNSTTQQDIENIYECKFIDWNNFRDKSFLITGATGLIGSQLVLALVYANKQSDINIKITALVRSKKKAKIFFGKELRHQKVTFIEQDITKKVKCSKKIDYIIHCASNTSSKSFIETPVETIDTIVNGTKNILEFAKEKNAESIVYLSSMEVYGQVGFETNNLKENEYGYIDILNARSSYSEGKRLAECLCYSYYKEFNLPVKIARLTQIIGANANYNDKRVINEFARNVIEETDIVLHTSGNKVHSYCYITDAITAILTILLKGREGEAYNVANDKAICSIKEMAEMLVEKYVSSSLRFESNNTEHYPPDTYLKLDTHKMKALGWFPSIDFNRMFSKLISSFCQQRQKLMIVELGRRPIIRLLKQVFSIKNKDYHKVITFLGIRIKLRIALFNKYYMKIVQKKSKIQNNKIVFCQYEGSGYGCNLKYITEEIIKRKLPYELVWLVRKGVSTQEIPPTVRCVSYLSKECFLEHATSKFWIRNASGFDCVRNGIVKDAKQIYIQTWHGSLGIKKMRKDESYFSKNSRSVNRSKIEGKMVDIWVSNSDFEDDIYKRAFWDVKDEKIKRFGHPRNDIFFKNNDNKIKEKVKTYFKIPKSSKILLYAPSFRNNKRVDCYNLNYNRLLKFINTTFQDLWYIFIRYHPKMSFYTKLGWPKDIINATAYSDMQELLVAAIYL